MRRAEDRVFCLDHGSSAPGRDSSDLNHHSSGLGHRSSARAHGPCGPAHRSSWLLPRLLLIVGLVAPVSGCYVMQAATGEMHVLQARKPIGKVISDPGTPESLKETLTEVRAAREFASRKLELPDNESYRTYSNIKRPFVVWNVVATPEFSIHPKQWCFPIVGCVSYRGYFSERRARKFAEGLRKRGFDVTLDGVPAYSTLGKFADPVLSTMLPYGPDELAATIFHELAHQLLYVKNDTQFNEAFATTVENAGLERWLKFNGRADRFQRYRKDSNRERQFVELFAHTRAQLLELYASGAAPEKMREKKAQAFAELATEIRNLEKRLGLQRTLYDQWIKEGLNNARLASEANYYDCVPGFERLLAEQDNDLPRFYAAARAMSKLPIAERHAKLCRTPTEATEPRDESANGAERR
jgi:predicted aminopeptidase